MWPHYSGPPGAREPRFIKPPEPPVSTPLEVTESDRYLHSDVEHLANCCLCPQCPPSLGPPPTTARCRCCEPKTTFKITHCTTFGFHLTVVATHTLHQLPVMECTLPPFLFLHRRPFSCLKPGFHSNAIACVSCGFRLRNARNASDCV